MAPAIPCFPHVSTPPHPGGHTQTAPSGRKEHPLAKGKSHSNREVKKPKQAKKLDLNKAGDPFAKAVQAISDKKKS
ncbi:MAG: hypothetical protein CFE34_11065 [Rhodobacteraceae bacterium PARR1]|nr:MAG: hypothetical protein CFE34_11065 [Rhodobacteraceae bacterium PARR1]